MHVCMYAVWMYVCIQKECQGSRFHRLHKLSANEWSFSHNYKRRYDVPICDDILAVLPRDDDIIIVHQNSPRHKCGGALLWRADIPELDSGPPFKGFIGYDGMIVTEARAPESTPPHGMATAKPLVSQAKEVGSAIIGILIDRRSCHRTLSIQGGQCFTHVAFCD